METVDFSSIIPTPHYYVHRTCGPGWTIPERTIADHELVLIEQGRGTIWSGEARHAAGPGLLCYFPPHRVHALASDDASPLVFHALHFGYLCLPEDEIPRPAPTSTALAMATLQYPSQYLKLQEAFKRFAGHWQRRLPGYLLACRASLLEILFDLAEEMQAQRLHASSQDKIETVISYLNAHPQEHLSISQLAALVQITPDYLGALFKHYTGHTPVAYMNRQKIDAAKALLMEGHLTVREIAHHLGFTDEFYFSRVFRQYARMSPSAFRRRLLSEPDT